METAGSKVFETHYEMALHTPAYYSLCDFADGVRR